MKPFYPLDQSPLFRLQSRKKLGELLGLTIPELERLANDGVANYSIFDKETKSGKSRHIEWPQRRLRIIQRSITRLLGRIAPPPYLHSAYRGRSYVTNAQQHQFGLPTAKIDIKSFFPSAQSTRVAKAFRVQFGCSLDVAAVLTKLTTLFGHIPTGGNSSTIISFWAYRPMFEEIYERAQKANVVMTCCVDDMTFTGAAVKPGFMNDIRVIIRRYGLRTHKERYFQAADIKIVTGIAITSGGQRLPNSRRQKLHNSIQAAIVETNLPAKLKLAESALGRATEAEQVEPRFRSEVYLTSQLLSSVRREVRRQHGP